MFDFLIQFLSRETSFINAEGQNFHTLLFLAEEDGKMPFSEITMATATCGKDSFLFFKVIRHFFRRP